MTLGKRIKRCLSLLCCLICLMPLLTTAAMAVSDVSVDSEPWDYLYIYPNDEVVTPNIVIIYLHGSNNSGYSVESLQNLARVDHPLKYAREGTLPLPDDTIFICPQSRADGEFGNKRDKLSDFIHEIAQMFPDALIVLAGHSSGCIAVTHMANIDHPDVDGYVFIGGIKTANCKLLTDYTNCLVTYGNESWLSKRSDFAELFDSIDLTDKEFGKNCSFLEEDRNNAYLVGPWTHGAAPKIFLEDLFWEWLNNISYN